MRSLCDLLATWNDWSARDTLHRALDGTTTDRARETLTRSLADMPEVGPLEALQDATELLALLQSWQWQAVYAARYAGAGWTEIGMATGMAGEDARAKYLSAISFLERHKPCEAKVYRDVA